MKAPEIELLSAWRAALGAPDLGRIEAISHWLMRSDTISALTGLFLAWFTVAAAVLLLFSFAGWVVAAILGTFFMAKSAPAMWNCLLAK